MNKQQWLILALGSAAAVLPLMLAIATDPTPYALDGPTVETSPGHYSQSFTKVIALPTWAALSAVGVVVLTGVTVYKSRNLSKGLWSKPPDRSPASNSGGAR